MATNAERLIFSISEIFYQNGKYGLERVSLICRIIFKVLFAYKAGQLDTLKQINNEPKNYFRDLLQEEYNELYQYIGENQLNEILYLTIELIKNYKNKDIANAIQKLVDNDRNKDLIPTDDFSIKIMQAFAKKMNNGYYVDPCIGSGRLLGGLNARNLIGYDINKYCKDIAETYLNLLENNKTRFDLKLSTENFLYIDSKFLNELIGRTFIFDPPLNDSLELYGKIYEDLSSNNIYNSNNKIPSEYAFLSKILFDIPDKVHTSFICIFANNFLSAQDKFKTSFRKYLMENSLIAAIQSNFSEGNNIQKLILVGKSHLDNPQDSLRYFITPKDKNISEEDISKIVQKCLNNETFDEKEFYDIAKIKAYTLEEIRENDYQISMPQYLKDEINPNEIKSLSEIVNDLEIANENLVNTSKNLEILLNNLQSGIVNDSSNNQQTQEQYSTDNIVLNWFDKDYSDLNNAIGIFSHGKVVDWTPIDFDNDNNIYIDSIYSCVNNLKLLYQAKRLRYNGGLLEINSKEILDDNEETKKFSDYILEDSQKDEYIKNMFANLSKKQIEIFYAFVKLHFDNENTFNKFTISETHSAIATFKVLGLLYDLPNIEDELEKYFPYTPILNIKEEE